MVHLDTIILIALTGAALYAALTRSLLNAAIGLAVASAVVALALFRLDAPWAAVFELSVCAGLIAVLFISTISLTDKQTKDEKNDHLKERLRRYWPLPFILLALVVLLAFVAGRPVLPLAPPEAESSVRQVIWSLRPLDVVGQVMALLAGVFGIVVLIKEGRNGR